MIKYYNIIYNNFRREFVKAENNKDNNNDNNYNNNNLKKIKKIIIIIIMIPFCTLFYWKTFFVPCVLSTRCSCCL